MKMKNKYAKIERFLKNQTEEGKNQMIKFLLEDTLENCNKGFIFRAIEEYSIMYPELNRTKAILDDSLELKR